MPSHTIPKTLILVRSRNVVERDRRIPLTRTIPTSSRYVLTMPDAIGSMTLSTVLPIGTRVDRISSVRAAYKTGVRTNRLHIARNTRTARISSTCPCDALQVNENENTSLFIRISFSASNKHNDHHAQTDPTPCKWGASCHDKSTAHHAKYSHTKK